MIAFDLQCANGHSFEGWFEDNNAYDAQMKKGLISCPVCNSSRVQKIPSTFAIKSSQPVSVKPKEQKEQAEMEAFGQRIVDYVKSNFDDVGCNFSKEALKIHYGVSEPRNIRGVSTKDEEKTLEREGVQFFKLPMPAESDPDA